MKARSFLEIADSIRLGPDEDTTTPIGLDEVVAVKAHSTVLDATVWLVKDARTLDEHPDIKASGLAIYFYDELATLDGKSPEHLRAAHAAKVVFPGSKVIR